MTDDQLNQVVKSLEPHFIGYTARENRLENSNGMELLFYKDWKGKSTVVGLHAKHRHSIGCSLEKSPEKIFKDVWKRLIPEYHKDFFKHKREKQEDQEHKEAKAQMLKAIASVIGGEIRKDYGSRYSGYSDFVHAQNLAVYEEYSGGYEINIRLDCMNTMKLAQYLKNSGFIDEKKKEEND